jgi:hypothetical protein
MNTSSYLIQPLIAYYNSCIKFDECMCKQIIDTKVNFLLDFKGEMSLIRFQERTRALHFLKLFDIYIL